LKPEEGDEHKNMMRPDKYVMGCFRKSLDFLVGFVVYNLPSSLSWSSSSTIYKQQHHLLDATSNYALISSLAHEFSHFHKSCVNETELQIVEKVGASAPPNGVNDFFFDLLGFSCTCTKHALALVCIYNLFTSIMMMIP
jgi:predicted transglutaminase-like protease